MNKLRKWCRILHRDVSFFFSGLIIIYAISGIAMNHRDTFNPNFTIEKKEYVKDYQFPAQQEISEQLIVNDVLKPLEQESNYTKHYFPTDGTLKIFLKGGSNIVIDTSTGKTTYEIVTRKTVMSSMVRIHYNPNRWWTIFSDLFSVCLILITMTGIVMVKGNKGFFGRGGIELAIGIAIPIVFMFLTS